MSTIFINTDQVSRTLADGGWTPAIINVSGTDISITGHTEWGESVGEITITGSVTNLIIDIEQFTAIENGIDKRDIINKDFSLYIGPGKTYFTVTGATYCTIEWKNRWYL